MGGQSSSTQWQDQPEGLSPLREDQAKGDDEDNVMDDAEDDEDDCNDDEYDVHDDIRRYERRRSHVLREKKRHGE